MYTGILFDIGRRPNASQTKSQPPDFDRPAYLYHVGNCLCRLLREGGLGKDGDTIEVMKEGAAVSVRLNGIDCPEKGQAFGQRAKKFTSDLCFGRRVGVIEKGRDRYGRTIGEVMLEDGRNLNQELVRSGMAWWYRKYAERDANLESLERHAREARAGLWVDADPTPPWNWRKRRQIKK